MKKILEILYFSFIFFGLVIAMPIGLTLAFYLIVK